MISQKNDNPILKMSKRLLLIIIFFILYLALDQYLLFPRFEIETPHPFTGTKFYNPYKDVSFSNFLLANFHGHTKEWAGLTNGKGNDYEAQRRYDSLGYDLTDLSQYEFLDTLNESNNSLDVYEHGINIKKTHQLVIGSHSVVWFDYFLPQTLNQKQYVLNLLAADTNNIIVINHPNLRHGYSTDDVKYLQNYDYLEGIHPRTQSIAHWDTALTYGHPVYIMGNDDYHDIYMDNQIGNCLTGLFSSKKSGQSILHALKQGNTMAVKLNQNQTANLKERAKKISRLRTLFSNYKLSNDTLSITLTEVATIQWVGKNGIIKQKDSSVQSIYHIDANDTYIRTQILTKDSIEIFLNPIYRIQNDAIASRYERSKQYVKSTPINLAAIKVGKLFFLILFISIIWKWNYVITKYKRTT